MRGSGSAQWLGRVRKSPAGLMNSADAADLVGLDRDAAQRRLAREQRLDLLLAFLGLERADAIDEEAARLGQRRPPGRAGAAAGR